MLISAFAGDTWMVLESQLLKGHFGTMLEQTLLLMQKLYLTVVSDGVLFLAQAVLVEQEVRLTSKT
jgi:hypothetical protein